MSTSCTRTPISYGKILRVIDPLNYFVLSTPQTFGMIFYATALGIEY